MTPLLDETDSVVRDSVDFITMMKEWIIPDQHKMVSFDITSLLTNIPTKLVTRVTKKRLEAGEGLHVEERTDLAVVEILILFKILFGCDTGTSPSELLSRSRFLEQRWDLLCQ